MLLSQLKHTPKILQLIVHLIILQFLLSNNIKTHILFKVGLFDHLVFDFIPIFRSCNFSLAHILLSNTNFFYII